MCMKEKCSNLFSSKSLRGKPFSLLRINMVFKLTHMMELLMLDYCKMKQLWSKMVLNMSLKVSWGVLVCPVLVSKILVLQPSLLIVFKTLIVLK